MVVMWWLVDGYVIVFEVLVEFVDVVDFVGEVFEVLFVGVFFWVLVVGEF